jgi:NADH-quinone oxidoreductase subunit G
MLDDERCILCSRCIRFSKEIAHDDVLGFIDRGSHSTLTCYPGKKLEHNYSLNTVDICPVGALTSTDFRFKMRVWFLKQTNSLDFESSVGVNTVVWSREGAIYRITPRRNDGVNDTWMADSGRELYKQVRAADRLTAIKVNGADSGLPMAVHTAGELFKTHAGAVAVVGSGRSTVEEQFLSKKLAAALGAPVHLVSRVGQGDGILVSADRNPNLRGALVVGLINVLPALNTGAAATPPRSNPGGGLAALAADIDAGRIKAVVAVNEDLMAAGLTAAQIAKVAVIYLGTHANATAAAAQVVLPTLTVFEKDGTFVNQQFRVQKFHRAVPPPGGPAADPTPAGLVPHLALTGGPANDLVVLTKLIEAAGAPSQPTELGALWAVLAAEVPALATMTFANLPETGLLLDSTPWAALPFVEGETLHFKPAAPAAAT